MRSGATYARLFTLQSARLVDVGAP
jgi:hypothetical protein